MYSEGNCGGSSATFRVNMTNCYDISFAFSSKSYQLNDQYLIGMVLLPDAGFGFVKPVLRLIIRATALSCVPEHSIRSKPHKFMPSYVASADCRFAFSHERTFSGNTCS